MPRTSADRAARDTEIRASGLAGGLLADRFGLTATQIGRIRAGVPRPPTKRERFALSVAGEGWVAACMEPDEWAEWVRTNPRLNDATFVDRPCADCPLGFAAEMRAIGRCNGSPGAVGGRHEPDEDEEGEGPVTLNQERPPEAPVRVAPVGKTAAAPSATEAAAAFARFSSGRAAHVASLNSKLTDRQQLVIDELRRLGSRRAVQEALGVKHLQSIDGTLIDAFGKGLLPAGLPDLPRRLRAKAHGRPVAKAAHIVSTESRTSSVDATAAASGPTPVAAAEPVTPSADPHVPELDAVYAGVPCGSCSHAAVCSIRPLVDAFAEDWRATRAPASPHQAITVEARVVLTCTHYLAEATS